MIAICLFITTSLIHNKLTKFSLNVLEFLFFCSKKSSALDQKADQTIFIQNNHSNQNKKKHPQLIKNRFSFRTVSKILQQLF